MAEALFSTMVCKQFEVFLNLERTYIMWLSASNVKKNLGERCNLTRRSNYQMSKGIEWGPSPTHYKKFKT